MLLPPSKKSWCQHPASYFQQFMSAKILLPVCPDSLCWFQDSLFSGRLCSLGPGPTLVLICIGREIHWHPFIHILSFFSLPSGRGRPSAPPAWHPGGQVALKCHRSKVESGVDHTTIKSSNRFRSSTYYHFLLPWGTWLQFSQLSPQHLVLFQGDPWQLWSILVKRWNFSHVNDVIRREEKNWFLIRMRLNCRERARRWWEDHKIWLSRLIWSPCLD